MSENLENVKYKIQQIMVTLQHVEITATKDNLQYLYASLNTLEEIENQLTELIERSNEVNQNGT